MMIMEYTIVTCWIFCLEEWKFFKFNIQVDLEWDIYYKDFYVISKENVTLQLENAEKFVAEVRQYVE